MPYASNTTVASGSTAVVAVPFPYLEKADVSVSLNGSVVDPATITWLSPSSIQLPSTPANGVVIKVYRSTPASTLNTVFSDPSVLEGSDLNRALLQMLYVTQEANDLGTVNTTELAAITDYVNTAMAAAAESAAAALASANSAAGSVTTIAAEITGATAGAVATANTAAATATTQAGIATTEAGIATTQAGIATTEAGIATTQAGNASTSATGAASSATSAGNSASAAASEVGGHPFTFDASTTMGAPSAGGIRLNNATATSATALALSSQTAEAGNPNILNFLKTWDDSSTTGNRGTLIVRKMGDATKFVTYSITGVVTDNTTWVQIGVAGVVGAGSFTAADKLSVQFSRTGDTGASGAGSGDMLSTNNLSDVASASTSRTNLGLGSAAVRADTFWTQVANNLSDLASAATARTNLGLGTSATVALTALAQVANNLSDLANAGTARTNLGVAIGSNVQAYDADLDALAGLTTAADKVPYFTGSHAAVTADLTSVARTLIAQTTQALMRSTGLGSTTVGDAVFIAATAAAARSALGSTTVGDAVFIAVSAAAARTAIGTVIGTDVQAHNANLDALAGLTGASGKIPGFTGAGAMALVGYGTTAVANNLMQLDGSGKLPALDGSQLTGITAGQPVPTTSAAFAVGTAMLAQLTIGTVANGATVAGSSLNVVSFLLTTAGCVPNLVENSAGGAALTGTWKNLTGFTQNGGTSAIGYWVRTV